MKNGLRFLIIGALVLLATGLLWTIGTGQAQHAFRQRMDRRLQDLERLQQLRQAQARPLQVRAALEALPQGVPPELNRLLAEYGPDATADVRRRDTVSVGTGWQARRWEVHFDSVDLHALADWLRVLEQQRPPWRLIEGEWHSSDHPAGYARVTLILEGLHQTTP